MISSSFSLTEQFIINPVLTMQAPPLENSCFQSTLHWIESELISRVFAVFTSVFAAGDALIHLGVGIFKGGCLIGRIGYNSSQVLAHFQEVMKFAVMIIKGSLVGLISPSSLKSYLYVPYIPENDDNAPDEILKVASEVINGKSRLPYANLKGMWKKSSLEEKYWFVRVFSYDNYESFVNVRTELASIVYKALDFHQKDAISWLSERELAQKNFILSRHLSICAQGVFYHATSKKSLEAILKSKKIEVRHEKLYRGAFVSTNPETSFGNCILVFRKNIERLSELNHGFTLDEKTYWAGFSRDIPVLESTLAYILLNGKTNEDYALEGDCFAWTQRHIPVISLNDFEQYYISNRSSAISIPSEWPFDSRDVANKIFAFLKQRARQTLSNDNQQSQVRINNAPVLLARIPNREYGNLVLIN